MTHKTISLPPHLKTITLAALLATAGMAQAQDGPYGFAGDVVLFSNNLSLGTARMSGVGGATTGLGGDVTNAGTNPAGLGFLRRSEFTITPGLLVTGNQSSRTGGGNFIGGDTSRSSSAFNIGQLGLVLARPKDEIVGGAFRGGAFAITYSSSNYYNSYSPYSYLAPYNPSGRANSYLDYYTDIINQGRVPTSIINVDVENNNSSLTAADYEARLAYRNYLSDVDTSDPAGPRFYSEIPVGDVRQRGRVYDKGRQTEFNLAYGANFGNRLYIGGGIGLPRVSYTRDVLYNEQIVRVLDNRPSKQPYAGFSFARQERYNYTGFGINAKIGAIYAATDRVRVGASIQTPTALGMQQDYSFGLSSNFTNFSGQQIKYYGDGRPGDIEPQGDALGSIYRITRFRYGITTPWKFATGLTLLDPTLGFVTAEATLLTYSNTKLRRTGDAVNWDADNQQLRLLTRNQVLQIRAGAEGKVGIARVRLGASYQQSPYKNSSTFNNDPLITYSGGAGIRLERYTIDLSVSYWQRRQSYQVFEYASNINTKINNVLTQLTFGTFF